MEYFIFHNFCDKHISASISQNGTKMIIKKYELHEITFIQFGRIWITKGTHPTHTHTLESKDRKTSTLQCTKRVQKSKITHVKNIETTKIDSHQ